MSTIELLYTCSGIDLLSLFLLSACAKWHPSSPIEDPYSESGQDEVEEVASFGKSTQLPDPAALAKVERSSHE